MLLDNHPNRSVIDFMRAVGILLVICFHVVIGLTTLLDAAALGDYIDAMPQVFNVMWQALGSEIIFLFSGFLLSYLLLREHMRTGRIDVRDFYVRRMSRIVPMYLLAVLLYAFVIDFDAYELPLNLLFVSKIFDATTIVPVGWSLEVLVQSYVLLPLYVLAMLKSGRPVSLTVAAIVVFLCIRCAEFALHPASYQTPIHALFAGTDTTPTQDDAYYLLVFRATPFLLGFLLAYAVIHGDAWLRRVFARGRNTIAVLLAGLVIIAGSGFLPVHDPDSWLYAVAGDAFWLGFWTAQRFVLSVGVSLLSLSLWYGTSALTAGARRFAGWPVWKRVSANIYSIYLFHPLFLIPAAAAGFRTIEKEGIPPVHVLEVIVTIVVAATLSTAFGSLLTRFFELPAQAWIRGKLGRREERGPG